MFNKSTDQQDCAPALTGNGFAIPWRVVAVAPSKNFSVIVRFVDGTQGTVHLFELIHSPRAGVFGVLADANLFAKVYVDKGAVTWPGDLDLAPDAMYVELKQNGIWKL